MGSVGYNQNSIPIVDISRWFKPGATEADKDAVAQDMSDACHTYGFFYLIGHGITDADRQMIMDCCKLFFTQTREEKMDVWIGKCMGKAFRGYEPPGIQVHQEGLLPDTKEALIIGQEVSADDPKAGTFSTGPNLWPTTLPDELFRNRVMKYQSLMVDLVKVLLRILSRGLPKEWGLKETAMDEFAEGPPSIPMRLLHYAPQPTQDARQFGVGDHTDFGGVTILLQDGGSEGLEVWYPPTETWISVPVIDGSYVINMGDMMAKWTSGYYRSARHRVITSSERSRYSVPFFLNGNLDLNCRALDGSGVETNVGEHIRGRLVSTMGKTGKALA